MKYLSRILLITFVFVFSATYSHADSWRDKTELLIYSPRYFGPNAFPIPEMRDGQVSERYEVEVRGEYHYYTGEDLGHRGACPAALLQGARGNRSELVLQGKI